MTSNFVVSMPRVRTAPVELGTSVRAEHFLRCVADLYHRNAKAVPINGADRTHRRKLDPDDTLNLSDREIVAILRAVSDENACVLLAALAEDAGKSIDIAIGTSTLAAESVQEAERKLAVLEANFLATVDEVVVERKPLARSLEARRLRNLHIGIESRIHLLLEAAESGDPA